MNLPQEKIRAAGLSVISNTFLILLKVAVGLAIGSVSILSEAVHSAVDLVAAGIALFSVRTSSVPADTRHPFGHGKAENLSGVAEALLIFLAAGWIIVEAVERLLHPKPLGYVVWGIAVMLVSAAANCVVSERLFRVGRAADSVALQADAWHLRTDVYTSAGVMAGLAALWVGNAVFPRLDLHWIDPAIALAVGLLILRAAWRLTLQSARDLMDVQLPESEEAWIRERIVAHRPIIHGFHRLRTRKAGNFRFVEFHIKVDPEMSVQDSHRITEELTRDIEGHFPSASVTIHTEPCDGDCVGNCLTGCLLTEDKRRALRDAARRIAR